MALPSNSLTVHLKIRFEIFPLRLAVWRKRSYYCTFSVLIIFHLSKQLLCGKFCKTSSLAMFFLYLHIQVQRQVFVFHLRLFFLLGVSFFCVVFFLFLDRLESSSTGRLSLSATRKTNTALGPGKSS